MTRCGWIWTRIRTAFTTEKRAIAWLPECRGHATFFDPMKTGARFRRRFTRSVITLPKMTPQSRNSKQFLSYSGQELPRSREYAGWEFSNKAASGPSLRALKMRSLDREIFGRLPRFFDVMIRAAEILKAIHALGIVHGDVKPANVLINNRQEIEWIDFEREKFSEGFTALDEKNEPIIENQGRDTDTFSFIMTLVTMMDVVMKGGAVSDEVRPWFQQQRDGYLALILEKLPEGVPYPRTNAPSRSLSQRLKSAVRSATAALHSRSSRRSGHGAAFQIGANYFPEGFIQKSRSQWPPDMEVVLQKLRSDREQALLHSEARGRAATSG